jgi:hypothetical protein
MRTNKTLSVLFGGLLLVGSATAALSQTESQDHDAHHPAETQSAPAAPTGDATPPAGMQGGMPGMGMMTPEMMQMMQRMMGQGGMPGMMGSQGTLLGTPLGSPEEMTEDRVRTLLEQQLISLGNPRLRLGALDTAGDGSITAEIVTVDGSLVQKLAFNRHPGLVRQID